jgi:hypothetical protein
MERVKAPVRLAVMAELRKAHAVGRDISDSDATWIDLVNRMTRLWSAF